MSSIKQRLKRKGIPLVVSREIFHKDMLEGKRDRYTYREVYHQHDILAVPLISIIRKWSKPK